MKENDIIVKETGEGRGSNDAKEWACFLHCIPQRPLSIESKGNGKNKTRKAWYRDGGRYTIQRCHFKDNLVSEIRWKYKAGDCWRVRDSRLILARSSHSSHFLFLPLFSTSSSWPKECVHRWGHVYVEVCLYVCELGSAMTSQHPLQAPRPVESPLTHVPSQNRPPTAHASVFDHVSLMQEITCHSGYQFHHDRPWLWLAVGILSHLTTSGWNRPSVLVSSWPNPQIWLSL